MVAPAASHSRPEAADLLVWYDRHRRALPWRALPGVAPDPYRVWLSEIMLQQTTVAAVKPYFARFLERFPTIEALAAAPEDAVMGAWAGLGYYSRARNLHACAKAVAEAGGFPDTVEGLRKLPGIGAYTAGAIAAIAFDRPAAAVDGNVERVVSRLYAIETPIPAARAEIRRLAEGLVPHQRPGDFAQAVMDLGATLCTPKRPACALCPWMRPCRARAEGLQETFPRKVKKVAGALRRGAAFVVLRTGDDAVLLRTRPPEGLLGAMAEPPTSEWRADYDPAQALLDAPLDARWKRLPGTVRHVFTHFPLELTVFLARVAAGTPAPDGMRFTPRAGLDSEPLPGAMKKVLAHALEQKLAAPPAAPVPPPAPDLATLPEPEPPPRRAPLPKVLSRRPASAAPVTKPVGRGRPRER
ncbi:A/G-specific adenine glycosylase [Methylobacterium sp. 17Sr1-1]|uniref:A/G-specific adenine glycosylase n=1 Tax=Methylobacterium sp. 17Sr1-1 TaxID=2202826 RepID=UPI000D6EC56F|nr:A/G-specific adenine glycosylase [Methylobacterium sp. 17Sr1-1]AWN53986.1 A/G-specific adenine glycosylase [Methylobacterium sp. 17Sr1-1]